MDEYKEVIFDEFCPKCKHALRSQNDNPCDECLDEPINLYSHKPVKFEEVTKN